MLRNIYCIHTISDRPCPAPIEQLNEHRDEADGNTEDLWYFDVSFIFLISSI